MQSSVETAMQAFHGMLELLHLTSVWLTIPIFFYCPSYEALVLVDSLIIF